MAIAQMPLELTGNVSQTRELINQFSDNLAPDHVFWQEFAEVVQLAFPAESMAADNLLAHQIHQFRLCDFCLPSTVGTRIFSSSK